jgi:hypothetical protein
MTRYPFFPFRSPDANEACFGAILYMGIVKKRDTAHGVHASRRNLFSTWMDRGEERWFSTVWSNFNVGIPPAIEKKSEQS